jgi:phage gp29-like protein
LPVGWDVKLIESNGRGGDIFQEEINTSDNEYTVAVAGQIVTTTGGTGFANADIHARIREDLIDADGDALSYTINTQGLPSFIMARGGGPQALTDKWVNVRWDTSTPKELESEAKTLQTLAQGIAQLAQVLAGTGKRLNLDELATRFGIPLESNKVPGDSTAPVVELKAAEVTPAPAKPKLEAVK